MKILSITAQKPHSTGSGVFLTELVRGFDRLGMQQAVIAGITEADETSFPDSVRFYPVYFDSAALPFPITGMSDEMPYRSTRYCDLTPDMLQKFRAAFSEKLREVERTFHPDLVICHHLYLLTAITRDALPDVHMIAICHGSDLRQLQKNPLCRAQILAKLSELDEIWALHRTQKEQILKLVSCPPEKVNLLGTGFNQQIFFRRTHAQSAQLKPQTAHGTVPAFSKPAQMRCPDSTSAVQPNDAPFRSSGTPTPMTARQNPRSVRLLFAGKLSEKKGVMSLLRALSLLPSSLETAARSNGLDRTFSPALSLCLAGGHGNEQEYLEIKRLAAACPYLVSFLGRLSQPALAEEMNACDLFVLPSFYEGLPLVLAEAMACGMRAVCTDLPGVQDWLCSNVPHHTVRFVTPPKMKHTDEPLPEALPAFELRLADTIAAAVFEIISARQAAVSLTSAGSIALPCRTHTDESLLTKELEALSWDGLCQKLLQQ